MRFCLSEVWTFGGGLLGESFWLFSHLVCFFRNLRYCDIMIMRIVIRVVFFSCLDSMACPIAARFVAKMLAFLGSLLRCLNKTSLCR